LNSLKAVKLRDSFYVFIFFRTSVPPVSSEAATLSNEVGKLKTDLRDILTVSKLRKGFGAKFVA